MFACFLFCLLATGFNPAKPCHFIHHTTPPHTSPHLTSDHPTSSHLTSHRISPHITDFPSTSSTFACKILPSSNYHYRASPHHYSRISITISTSPIASTTRTSPLASTTRISHRLTIPPSSPLLHYSPHLLYSHATPCHCIPLPAALV